MAGLYEDNLFLNNFYQFLESQAYRIHVPSSPIPLPEPIREGIAFQDVRFSYPGGTKSILEGVNLTLHPGEVIALVGENGSGKSTLIKLFCRLYDPTEGSITVDSIDLREIDPVSWRRKIAVLFQDYVHYYLSAKENIWVGSVVRDPESPDIKTAAQYAGADPIIQKLPKGYDTNLGHWFEEGQELSVGEWQKVALARSFFREAPIIVLRRTHQFDGPPRGVGFIQAFQVVTQGPECDSGQPSVLNCPDGGPYLRS